MVADLGIRTVALEWPGGLGAAIDDLAVLATAAAWSGDGRVTARHFAVLRRTGVHVVAVDEPIGPPSADARDAAMAANVEQALSSCPLPVLCVAGNLHTRLRRHAHYAPAGMHLAGRRPGLCALDIHYGRGRFWNRGPRTFRSSNPPGHPHVLIADASEAVVLSR